MTAIDPVAVEAVARMTGQRFDVVILGGGPAGSATALELSRLGGRVALLERSHYETSRIGETLPPRAALLLQRLGIWDDFQRDGHVESPGIVSIWGSDTPYENDFLFNPYGPGWHVDRQRFDRRLIQAASAAGTVVVQGVRVHECAWRPSGDWQVDALIGESSLQLFTPFLIDATGRAAWLAQRLGARRVMADQLVGIVGFFDFCSSPPLQDQRTFVEASENGWWYSAILPSHRQVVAFMTDADLLPRDRTELERFWRIQLANTIQTQARVQSLPQESNLRIVAADSHRLDPSAGSNWLAVGDAALAVDPLCGQGICFAMQSALDAARCVVDIQTGPAASSATSQSRLIEQFKDVLRIRSEYYSQERRWPHSPFWQRRQAME